MQSQRTGIPLGRRAISGDCLPDKTGVYRCADARGEGPLVGRVRELRELHDAFDDACRGRGGVHLVLGDPGVGKTRLAAALAEHAGAAGARVIWTRGWGRAAPPTGPGSRSCAGWRRISTAQTLRRELGSAADQLAAARARARRAPARRRGRRRADDEDSEIARFALFDALVALLRVRSARGPVVILMDDLQAVDEGSLVALDFVSRMLRDAAVLLVVTMHERVPDRTPDAQIALQNIVRSGRRLVLGGLTREDVGRLIELTSGVPPRRRPRRRRPCRRPRATRSSRARSSRCCSPRAVSTTRPTSCRCPTACARRSAAAWSRSTSTQLATLELAAIIGRTFHLADARARLAAGSRHRARGARRGRRARHRRARARQPRRVPLRARPDPRHAASTGMPIAARMTGHRVVGEALEHVYRGAIEAHLPELAHHFLCAAPRGDVAKAVDYAERAAYRALDTLAYEQAADLFARALEALERMDADVPRRAGLLLGLGTAQSRAGRPAARATFEAAVAAARAIEADDILARAALGFAPFALTPGLRRRGARRAARRGARAGRRRRRPAMRVRLLGSLAVALYWSDNAAPRAPSWRARRWRWRAGWATRRRSRSRCAPRSSRRAAPTAPSRASPGCASCSR